VFTRWRRRRNLGGDERVRLDAEAECQCRHPVRGRGGLASKKWARADAFEDGFSDSLRNLGVCLGSGLLRVEGEVNVVLVG
jgi:hypothetical protein